MNEAEVIKASECSAPPPKCRECPYLKRIRQDTAKEFLEAIEINLLRDQSWKTQYRIAKGEQYNLGYGQAMFDVTVKLIGELKRRIEKEQNDDKERADTGAGSRHMPR